MQRLHLMALVTLLLSACSYQHNTQEQPFLSGLQSSQRPLADKARDPYRKPAQIMDFARIEPAMVVLDLIAAGGYYTEVLSLKVGSKGKVYSHNSEFVRQARDGLFEKELEARLANGRLANVVRVNMELPELAIDQQVDAITMVLNYHDFYNYEQPLRLQILERLRQILKSDGHFLIIDADALPGDHDPQLHRIHHQRVKDDLLQAGFYLVDTSTALGNDKDDMRSHVFTESIRGRTNRFVFLFGKRA